jgi:hypothetical protein
MATLRQPRLTPRQLSELEQYLPLYWHEGKPYVVTTSADGDAGLVDDWYTWHDDATGWIRVEDPPEQVVRTYNPYV